jgi:hypothetical protein
MSTDFRNEAVQFLSKPENLPVALEVADLIEDVKDRLMLQFWHQLKDKLSGRESEFPGWSLRLDDAVLLNGRWQGLDWLPPIVSAGHPYLKLRVEKGTDNVYQGVSWKEEMKTPLDKLAERVRDLARIRELLPKGSNPWWVGSNYNRRGLRENSTWLRIQDGSFAMEVADEFVELADKLKDSVLEANKRLAE